MDPMRDVVKAEWRSDARASRGKIVGTVIVWELDLSCGHRARRYVKTGEVKKPTKARCRDCAIRETS